MYSVIMEKIERISIAKLFKLMKKQKLFRNTNGMHWSMLCPFHEEQTPSMMIDPYKDRFHCLGCGKIGSLSEIYFKLEN